MTAPRWIRECRWRALAPLLAFLLGFLAEELHVVVEAHRYCGVHAALEHGAAEHGGETSDDSPGGPLIVPAAERGGGHEQCRLVTLTNEDHFLVVERGSELPWEPRAPGKTLAAGEPRRESIPRYRLAPKGSPPRA